MKHLVALALCTLLCACGVAYVSPSVSEETTEAGLKVRVVPLTADVAIAANRAPYTPKSLPAELRQAFQMPRSPRTAERAPDPVFSAVERPGTIETRLPPQPPVSPYVIGVGDVLLFATPAATNTIEQLSGLLAAQNSRQGYTVQDDGAVAIPNVGRVRVAGMTIEGAESMLFERLVDAGMQPDFSLEIAEFGSQRVSVGGAVGNPAVIPLSIKPLTLNEAILAAGGVSAPAIEYAVIRLYRDGTLYQVPAERFFASPRAQNLRLVDGDTIFVDTSYDLERAQAYFAEQIQLINFRRSSRSAAISELQQEIALRQAAAEDRRRAFETGLEFGAVDRDYVYLAGEVNAQSRVALPFDGRATLADVLYGEGGFSNSEGNPTQIYVLRGSDNPAEFGGLTAYNLDARNAANLLLATRFEMRPNDIVFIAEQPVTRWNRAFSLIVPAALTQAVTSQ